MKEADPFDHYLNKVNRLFESKDDAMKDEEPGNPGDVDPDFERGETNFPHGHGYPNVDAKYEKVVHIDHIIVSDKIRDDYNRKQNKIIVHYIRKHLPWIFTSTSAYADRLKDSIDIQDIYEIVSDAYRTYKHWIHYSDKTPTSSDPSHWAVEIEKAKKIKSQYPNVDEDYKMFRTFMDDFIWPEAPDNPDNNKNYPVYVSLYDVTRNLGGHEEGGWWYDHSSLVHSIEAKDSHQAEKIAKMLYNKIDELDLDGKPLIVLEKEKGGDETKEAPKYS